MAVESVERLTKEHVLPARVVSIGSDAAVLAIDGNPEIRVPRTLLPAHLQAGAEVYLRVLTPAGLADESGEVARAILERFLN